MSLEAYPKTAIYKTPAVLLLLISIVLEVQGGHGNFSGVDVL